MLNLFLRRFHLSDKATQGALLGPDGLVCLTLELPWKDNLPEISCIPCGSFVATEVKSPKFGRTFDVSVPSRSYIRFHRGNSAEDSLGCILPVTGFVKYFGVNSGAAFGTFLDELRGVKQFRLHVENCG